MNAKIIAIVAVAVVVVAGGAGAFVMMNQNKDPVKVDASLLIMGNADNNAKIDSGDVDVIKKIINGDEGYTLEKYPLADANNDKAVNDADVELVEKMIKHEEGITINVVCTKTDKKTQYIQPITYPLKKTVVLGTNLISTHILVGAAEFIKGYTKTNYGVAHGSVIDHAEKLGGGIFDMDTDDSVKNFKALDAKIHLDAVVTIPSESYLKTSESVVTDAGIPLIRLNSSDGMDSIGGALTIGYIYGEDCEKIAYKYAEKSYEVLNHITNKVKDIKDEDKKTFVAITMGYYFSEDESDYVGVGEFAGGKNICTLKGNGSTKIKDGDEYYKTWRPDYMISFRTLDYTIDYTDISKAKPTTLTPKGTWDSYSKYFDMMGDSYKHLIYVNTSMPVICRMAYIAEIFYPDLFEDDYGNKVHQEFVNEFMDFLPDGFNVKTDMTVLITYDSVYPAA